MSPHDAFIYFILTSIQIKIMSTVSQQMYRPQCLSCLFQFGQFGFESNRCGQFARTARQCSVECKNEGARTEQGNQTNQNIKGYTKKDNVGNIGCTFVCFANDFINLFMHRKTINGLEQENKKNDFVVQSYNDQVLQKRIAPMKMINLSYS